MAIPTQGTILEIGDSATSAPAYTTIFQVVNIRGPGGVSRKIDTTHLLSVIKEYLPGLPDEGDLTFDANTDFSQATHQSLWDLRHSSPPEQRRFRITFTDSGNATIDFLAYVLGFEVNIQTDDRVLSSLTLAITTEINLIQ